LEIEAEADGLRLRALDAAPVFIEKDGVLIHHAAGPVQDLDIMASATYSKAARFTVSDIAARLCAFADNSDHAFWPDMLSIRDPHHFKHSSILSSKHLTDLYLLALAVENHGCLVTFDQHIPLNAVPTAGAAHLLVI